MSELREAHYALRAEAVEALRRDLFGPGHGDTELVTDPPATHYATGMLFPDTGSDVTDVDDVDEQEDGEEGAAPDPGVARAAARQPSSCGITFAVDRSAASRIRVTCAAARYLPADENGQAITYYDPSDRSLLDGSWRRQAVGPTTFDIDVGERGDMRHQLESGLELFTRVREKDARGVVAVTAVLLNTKKVSPGDVRDPATYFQASIRAESVDGASCFAERRFGSALVDDRELKSYDLLYRHARAFGVGHGCSAVWDAPAQGDLAATIRSEFLPECAVDLADSNKDITSDALSMSFCATADRADLIQALSDMRSDYLAWIGEVERMGRSLDQRYLAAVERHVADCRATSDRLQRGIDVLRDDGDSLRAFRLANEAMRIQRTRTDWARSGRQGTAPDEDVDGTWHPFQLAFILLCISGIADPHSDERDLVDLLWFPTGGGKTEAYLGLIAFTVFRRRIARLHGGGVTVIMRYTLRLLTIQQFSRAALLICCCEWLRRSRPDLGGEPISIGLWIGRGGTPNTRAEARASLSQIQKGVPPTEGDPRQLQSCPWCGTQLQSHHYWSGDSPPRIAISCRTKGCDFAKGLPVYLVDEDIYDYRPSLIIATADKFASMAWNPEIRSLFGLGLDVPPPELIVQDELHLISGPLGTLAGLYETAVDHLCREDGAVRPKVIASTATIRRASDQVTNLFDREMHQFPPPGIDARDSYFAVEAPADEKGNRLYVGVMAAATSQTTAMVRTYGSLLATVEESPVDRAVKDPYWTLLGYFNSLRVLGGARMQVQDDVVERLKFLLQRDSKRLMEPIEMTSRISSAEIPEHLARMETGLANGTEAGVLDVVLATNMISVGVDVDRLGLMVVMGQPQATAEYIQATSRVGRQHPGLVVVVFNPTRSRDRSHYESFQAFHGALYRQVESTSVTPFASRARDRGLHAVFIALCRMLIPGLRENEGAAAIAGHLADARAVRDSILERVRRVDAQQLDATRAELDLLLERWVGRAAHTPDLRYRDRRQPHRSLLVDAAGPSELGALPTLYSLRDVDLESSLQVI